MNYENSASGLGPHPDPAGPQIGFQDIFEQARQSVGNQPLEVNKNLNAHLGYLMQQVIERNEKTLRRLSSTENHSSSPTGPQPQADTTANSQIDPPASQPVGAKQSIETASMVPDIPNSPAKVSSEEPAKETVPSETASQGQADDFEGFRAYKEFCQYKEYLKLQNQPDFQSDFRRFFDWWRDSQGNGCELDDSYPAAGGEGQLFEWEFAEPAGFEEEEEEQEEEEGELSRQEPARKSSKARPNARLLARNHKFSLYPTDPMVYHGQGLRQLDEFIAACEREHFLCPRYFPTDQSKVLWAVRRLARKPAAAWHRSLQLPEYGAVLGNDFQDQLWNDQDVYSWNRFKRVLYEDIRNENGEEIVYKSRDMVDTQMPDLIPTNSASSKKAILSRRIKDLKAKALEKKDELKDANELKYREQSLESGRVQLHRGDAEESSGQLSFERASGTASPGFNEAVSRPMAGDELVEIIMNSMEGQSNAPEPDLPEGTNNLEEVRREIDRRLQDSLHHPGSFSSHPDEPADLMPDDSLWLDVADPHSPYQSSRAFSIERPVSGRIESSRRGSARSRPFRGRGRGGRASRGGRGIRGGRGGYRGA